MSEFEFFVGDAVRAKKGKWEHRHGIGLIVDKNPKYWFVQFPNVPHLSALRSADLNRIAGGGADLGRPLFWGSR